MSFRTSYSQNSTYISCPQYWSNSYIEKLKSDVEAASLFFGSAVDTAIMEMLKGKENYINIFKDRWHKHFSNGKAVEIFDNPNIVYSYSDFDEDVLLPKDLDTLSNWAKELEVTSLGNDGVEIYKKIVKIKKNPFNRPSNAEMKYFNRASWLSLKRKGVLLVQSFVKDFYPKIKKVVDVQKYAKITDHHTGDIIAGYIDMVLEIEGYDKPIIFDLKTSAQPYTQDQIELTEQLTLYSAMSANDYNTDLVGYVVLCKNINKEIESHCKSCAHKKSTRHEKCDNIINDKRCNGEWETKKILNPQVQVLVEKKTEAQVESLIKDYANIILAMKNGIVYKNTQKCNNWYGAKCIYFNYCHKNDSKGLKKG